MVALEREGYLAQPHTSAGRIPTDKGYRFFVDHLGGPGSLDPAGRQQVRQFFDHAHGEIEQMLERTSGLLADLTDCTPPWWSGPPTSRPPSGRSSWSGSATGWRWWWWSWPTVPCRSSRSSSPEDADEAVWPRPAPAWPPTPSGRRWPRSAPRPVAERRPDRRHRGGAGRGALRALGERRRSRAALRRRLVADGRGLRRRRDRALGAEHPRAAAGRGRPAARHPRHRADGGHRHRARRRAAGLLRHRGQPVSVDGRRPARSGCSARPG